MSARKGGGSACASLAPGPVRPVPGIYQASCEAAGFAALSAKNQVDEFRHLASGTHDERMWLMVLVFTLVTRFVPAFIEVTATGHPEAAPFALDHMQTADVPGDSSLLGFLLRFHGSKVTIEGGQPLSAVIEIIQDL